MIQEMQQNLLCHDGDDLFSFVCHPPVGLSVLTRTSVVGTHRCVMVKEKSYGLWPI